VHRVRMCTRDPLGNRALDIGPSAPVTRGPARCRALAGWGRPLERDRFGQVRRVRRQVRGRGGDQWACREQGRGGGVAVPGVALPDVLPDLALPCLVLPGMAVPGVMLPGMALPGVTLHRVALHGRVVESDDWKRCLPRRPCPPWRRFLPRCACLPWCACLTRRPCRPCGRCGVGLAVRPALMVVLMVVRPAGRRQSDRGARSLRPLHDRTGRELRHGLTQDRPARANGVLSVEFRCSERRTHGT
jgi:hypothetical protein